MDYSQTHLIWLTIDGSKLTRTHQWLLMKFTQVLQPIPSWLNWPITFNWPHLQHHRLTNTIHLTLKMTSAQNYPHLDDHTRPTTDTPGFKPFTMYQSQLISILCPKFGCTNSKFKVVQVGSSPFLSFQLPCKEPSCRLVRPYRGDFDHKFFLKVKCPTYAWGTQLGLNIDISINTKY